MVKLPDFSRLITCRECKRDTTHLCLDSSRIDKEAKQIDSRTYTWRACLSMKCRDCGSMTFLIDHYVGQNMGGDPGVEKTEYYPALPFRFKPTWFNQLPESYQEILNEVYIALDNSLYRLASAGTRTAIDCLIIDLIGDVGTFKDKVEALVNKGVIDNGEKDIFLALIDAGSASMHRSFNPDRDLVEHMMDILDKILFKVCIEPQENEELRRKAETLRKKTPKRK